MEHVLVAKISTVYPGDDYETVKVIELGDIMVNTEESLKEVVEKIGEKMGFENSRSSFDLFGDNQFYLEHDVTHMDFFMTKEETVEVESVGVQLESCLKIHGNLYKLEPFTA
ncbi:hypothetical protein [Rossellomorea marisflavi]|uniref:hypothetical protein n=1 Tax=Rossellomorea marisflavi TaxID=189381 RepID=UPI003FA18E62